MAHVVVPLNFNAFLEKAKFKDDGSNYTDWVRNLRIILIPAQKNYVLEAPMGGRPAADATNDVKNVWQCKADVYSIVQCAMLFFLVPGLPWRFECHGAYEMLQELIYPEIICCGLNPRGMMINVIIIYRLAWPRLL